MKRLYFGFLICLGLALAASVAHGQGVGRICVQDGGSNCVDVSTAHPFPDAPNPYPAFSTPITGNGTGTTGAVVGTLAAVAGQTTYICGLDVSALGGTATVGPITIAGTLGSSLVYQFSSTAAGATLNKTFIPCILQSRSPQRRTPVQAP